MDVGKASVFTESLALLFVGGGGGGGGVWRWSVAVVTAVECGGGDSYARGQGVRDNAV